MEAQEIDATPGALLRFAQERYEEYLAGLAQLVSIDSGSHSPDGVNRVADWVERRCVDLGMAVERVRAGHPKGIAVGDLLVARMTGRRSREAGGRSVLLMAHMDTVFEDGTAARRPFTLDGSRAYGPGVCDDKAGILAGLTALEVLRDAGWDDCAEVVFLLTPDEEIGSPASRSVTARLAADADYALCLECARENGDLVIARKGIAELHITVTGRAAHSGIEPERGANAALSAAHLVIEVQALNGRWDGVTVNVGTIRAGQRTNIVCPEAQLGVEVRASSAAALDTARVAVEALAARMYVPGTTAVVDLLDLRYPLEVTEASRSMYACAEQAGRDLGLTFKAAGTGGIADSNIAAGSGVPVLDGLGPVGGADHTPEEWLDTTTIAPRVALLASLISRLGTRQPDAPGRIGSPELRQHGDRPAFQGGLA